MDYMNYLYNHLDLLMYLRYHPKWYKILYYEPKYFKDFINSEKSLIIEFAKNGGLENASGL